jgi:NADPH:quinone reductase-like Zn-dependent oxidoreductase
MAPQNRAAWLMKKQDNVQVVEDAHYNKPEADEVVIQTMAVAINPADVALEKLGIIIDSYPAILGCDVAGVVEEVGSGIKDFKPGDHVQGAARPLPGGIYKYSGFQQYVVLKMPLIPRSQIMSASPTLQYSLLASQRPPHAFSMRAHSHLICRQARAARVRHC